ncbi:MAG: hypothetical protein R3B09_07510 [Nannocystaceae bacterium]
MPRPWWSEAPAIAVGLALGVALGVATAALAQPAPAAGDGRAGVGRGGRGPAGGGLAGRPGGGTVTLRDEAEALTPATLALEEVELERWLDRAVAIEASLADPATSGPIRVELQAALAALSELGVVRERDPGAP